MKNKHSMKINSIVKITAPFFVLHMFFAGCSIVDGPCVKGTGSVTTRTVSLSSFTGINMTMAGNVIIKKGENLQVQLEGQSNILDLISLDVSNKEWTIYPRECVRSYTDLNVYITMPSLESVVLTGSGTISSTDVFENDVNMLLAGSGKITFSGSGDKASIMHTGSGSVDFAGDYKDIATTISGSGSITMTGTCTTLKVTNSSSGGVDGFGLVASGVQVVSSGSGGTKVNATSTLDVTLSGSGSVYYKGNPAITSNDTGSGSIVNAN